MAIATATPAILPNPTVPESAAVRAWKCETSPSSSVVLGLIASSNFEGSSDFFEGSS